MKILRESRAPNAEVSALTTTAQNPAAVSPISQSADPSYNQTQMQQVMDKLDEILNAIGHL